MNLIHIWISYSKHIKPHSMWICYYKRTLPMHYLSIMVSHIYWEMRTESEMEMFSLNWVITMEYSLHKLKKKKNILDSNLLALSLLRNIQHYICWMHRFFFFTHFNFHNIWKSNIEIRIFTLAVYSLHLQMSTLIFGFSDSENTSIKIYKTLLKQR